MSNIARELERKPNVISRQAAGMEKDGLIKRTNDTPKSRLLKIALTEKGRDMLNIRDESKIIDAAWSFLADDERQELYALLYRMSSKLKEQDHI